LLCLKNLSENIDYAKNLRNNDTFSSLPIAIITNPPEKENIVIKNKISSLKINYFPIPINGNELTKFIRDSLDK